MCEMGPITKVAVTGSGKGVQGWVDVDEARVYHDHPFRALVEHAVLIDILNTEAGIGSRVALELTPESAQALAYALLEVAEKAQASLHRESEPVRVS